MRRVPCFFILMSLLVAAGCSDSEPVDDRPVDAGPPPVDQCLNPSDLEIVSRHNYADAGADAGADGGLLDIGTIGRNCAKGPCLSVILDKGDIDTCMNECYEASTATGLSQDCRDCYITAVYCGQEHCVLECLQPNPEPCTICLDESCFPRMNACTGI